MLKSYKNLIGNMSFLFFVLRELVHTLQEIDVE